MDKRHFAAITKALKSAYPNFKIIETEEAFNLWYNTLCKIPPETLNRAIYKHITTEKYPPAIADIIELAKAEALNQRTAALMASRQKQIKGPQNQAALGSRE